MILAVISAAGAAVEMAAGEPEQTDREMPIVKNNRHFSFIYLLINHVFPSIVPLLHQSQAVLPLQALLFGLNFMRRRTNKKIEKAMMEKIDD